jgi:hypothetical protein
LSKLTHDIVKAPLRLLPDDRSAANKNQVTGADNSKQEKPEEVKKITSTELEQPPQLKAYIKYPRYDFF